MVSHIPSVCDELQKRKCFVLNMHIPNSIGAGQKNKSSIWRVCLMNHVYAVLIYITPTVCRLYFYPFNFLKITFKFIKSALLIFRNRNTGFRWLR